MVKVKNPSFFQQAMNEVKNRIEHTQNNEEFLISMNS